MRRIDATPPLRTLTVARERRARSATGVEQTREENNDEAIADTSGRPCYCWGEEAGGTQIVESSEEECMGSSGIGEVHVDMIPRCRRENWSWGKVVGQFCHGHRSLQEQSRRNLGPFSHTKNKKNRIDSEKVVTLSSYRHQLNRHHGRVRGDSRLWCRSFTSKYTLTPKTSPKRHVPADATL